MPEPAQVIIDRGVTWVDVAMLAVASLTLLTAIPLVVGAFLAYRQTKLQIRQAATPAMINN